MWQRLFEILAEEIDNILYFFMALMLIILGVVIAKWLGSPDWIQNMITMLFGACLIKVKGGEALGKVAGAIRDIAVARGESPIGNIVKGVKDIVK